MISTSLQNLEHAVIERLGETDLPSLACAAKRLSDAFTKGRAGLPQDYMGDPDARTAYLAHFFLTNAAKVLHCLGEAEELGLTPKGDRIRILDLGSGPGTASLAASLFFAEHAPDARIEIVGIERSAAALDDAAQLFRKLGNEKHRFEPIQAALDREQPRSPSPLWGEGRVRGGFDIIIAANALNEFESGADALALCRDLVARYLEPDGFLLIIDPALRETTRPLMKLRDDLLNAGTQERRNARTTVEVHAPCLHRENCPMLAANERDWCHFYIEWERPALIRRMDELTGLDHRYLKMAYLLLAKDVPGPRSRVPGPETWRVVSSPLVSKGKRELVLCGSDGALLKAMRQDKNASEENRAFDEAKRGDVVSSPAEAKISKETSFGIVRRWG